MKDQTIIRIAEETTLLLRRMLPGDTASNILPSYNALLVAARQNHPDDPFLTSLIPAERSESAIDLAILFAQLRIAVEAAGSEETTDTVG